MKRIRQWCRSIRWLLNKPPIGLKQAERFSCDYCGGMGNWAFDNDLKFCFQCLKKVMDKVLKGK